MKIRHKYFTYASQVSDILSYVRLQEADIEESLKFSICFLTGYGVILTIKNLHALFLRNNHFLSFSDIKQFLVNNGIFYDTFFSPGLYY